MPSAVELLWQANGLWPGQAIVTRLREQVTDLRAVLLVDEFDAAQTVPRQLPAAIVLLDAMRPTPRSSVYSQPMNCEQDWMVAIAVRSARADADAASGQVGALLPQVVAALHAWKPESTGRAFVWRPGPRPNYGRDVTYYPLTFTLADAMA